MTTTSPIVLTSPAQIAAARIAAMYHGAVFEAKQRDRGSKMLITRVGGGALATAKRELGLPRHTKPWAVVAILEERLAAAKEALAANG